MESRSVLIENADKTVRARFNSPDEALEQLRDDCGYDPGGDGRVDELIGYKDALEDFAFALLDQLAREQQQSASVSLLVPVRCGPHDLYHDCPAG